MDNFKRKASISLISSYASQFATTAGNLATKLILARLIAPEDLGVYSLALFVLLACDMLMDLGITQHLAREKHRPYGNVLVIRVGIGALLFAGIQLGSGVMSFWDVGLPPVLRALAVVALIKAVAGVPNLFLERELLIQRSLLPQLLRLLVTALVSIGLAFYHYGVWALVWGTVAGEAAFAISIWRAASGRMPLDITWRYTGRLIRGSKYLFLIAVMGFALQQGDKAILGTLLDGRQVGFYTMALTLNVLVSKVVEMAIYRVIYPAFCEFKDDLPKLGEIYRKATLAITAVEAPIYFYILFNAPTVVSVLLGKKWMQAAILMQVLSVSGIVNPFSTFGYEVLRARKQDSMLTLSMALSAVTLMVSGYILTLHFGVKGMAAANYIIVGSLPTIITVYRTVRSDFTRLFWQLVFVCATSFVAIAAASTALSFAPYAGALAAGLLIPACWYMYYRLFGDGMGREALNSIMAKRRAATEVSV